MRLLAVLVSLQLVLGAATVAVAAPEVERRISLDVKDADLGNVLRLLADVGKVNVVFPEDVKAKVTVKLRNVRWQDALRVILRAEGMGLEKRGNVYLVDRLQRITERAETSAAIRAARVEAAELVTVIIPVRYARAGELKPLVASLLSPRGRVLVDERTNTLVVTDVANNIEKVRGRLRSLD